jgi:polyisoprenoid-binding protein YceI
MTTEAPLAATRTKDGKEVPVVGRWDIDPTHASINFEGRHMMIAKVRGSFTNATGGIEVTEDPANSSVEVTIETASVESGTDDRDNHLRSPDFFDVENYPHMTFRASGLEPNGDAYRLNGELTIKDVTRPVVLDFEFNGGLVDPYGMSRIAFSASTELDREDWGLTWNMALETGGVLVGKKIKIFIDVEAVKAS